MTDSATTDSATGTGADADLTVDVITIFPDYLAPLRQSLVGRAIERGQVDLRVHDLRRWTDDVHRTVDDQPYGGGPGMVMRPEPWGRALDEVAPVVSSSIGSAAVDGSPDTAPVLVIPTPTGRPFTQELAAELAQRSWLIFACGRYEGIDARVAADAARRLPVLELSLGDYVVAGGEVAVLAMVEATVRLLPGVLGNADSAAQDSFSDGRLEAPAYTRPPVWRGLSVPEVLRSGDHAAILAWRRAEAERLTRQRRPDLLDLPTSPPDPSASPPESPR